VGNWERFEQALGETVGELGMLAYIARRDVRFDIRCHSWPGVVAAYQFESFLYTVMAGGSFVVGLVEEGGAEVVVLRDVYEVVVSYEIVVESEML